MAISLWDKSKNFGCIGTFTHFEELATILQKVSATEFTAMGEILYGSTSYKYSQTLYDENPFLHDRVSGGSRRYLASSAFEKFSEIFFQDKPDDDEYIKILGRVENERTYRWAKRKYFTPPENLDKYKVLLPKSNGSGAIGEVLSTPLIGYTETFISFGNFDTEAEAEACLKYLKSRFARTMLGIVKVTQDNKTKEVWKYVPIQDFTQSSDIDWTATISEIDQQFYKKYNLDQSEIAFIEEKVKAME